MGGGTETLSAGKRTACIIRIIFCLALERKLDPSLILQLLFSGLPSETEVK